MIRDERKRPVGGSQIQWQLATGLAVNLPNTRVWQDSRWPRPIGIMEIVGPDKIAPNQSNRWCFALSAHPR